MWFSTITLLTIGTINKWHSIQVDFVLAYPQAPIKYNLYMEFPKVFQTKEVYGWTHVLQLLKNLYGQKQAGWVWNHHLNYALKSIGFKQSDVDDCVWYRYNTIFFCYVDDGIFVGPEYNATDVVIEKIRKVGLYIEDKGNIED